MGGSQSANNHQVESEYYFALNFERIDQIADGGWVVKLSEEAKKQVISFRRESRLEGSVDLSKGHIVNLSNKLFGNGDHEKKPTVIIGPFNAGKTKMLNDVERSCGSTRVYKSGEACSTEGINIALPGGQLSGIMILDTAGKTRPLSQSAIIRMAKHLQLQDNKEGNPRFKALRVPKKLRYELAGDDTGTNEYEKQLEERNKQAFTSALLEKIQVENFMIELTLDLGDIFCPVVSELRLNEQEEIDHICNRIKQNNQRYADVTDKNAIGLKSTVVHLIHNYKGTTARSTIQELASQFVNGIFTGRAEASSISENDIGKVCAKFGYVAQSSTSDTHPSSARTLPDIQDAVQQDEPRNNAITKWADVSDADMVEENVDEDYSTSKSSYGNPADFKIHKSVHKSDQDNIQNSTQKRENRPGSTDINIYHYVFGNDTSSEKEVLISNALHIEELKRKLSGNQDGASEPFLPKLVKSIETRLKTMYKKFGPVTVELDDSNNIRFKTTGPIEPIYKYTNMTDRRYVILDNNMKIDIDITINEQYASLIIESSGIKFKMPETSKQGLKSLALIEGDRSLKEVIEKTNIQEGEFSIIIDKINEFIRVFGHKSLYTYALRRDQDEECFAPLDRVICYAKEDENSKSYNDNFIRTSSTDTTAKTTMIQQNRKYGKFTNLQKLPQQMKHLCFLDPIVQESLELSTTVIIIKTEQYQCKIRN